MKSFFKSIVFLFLFTYSTAWGSQQCLDIFAITDKPVTVATEDASEYYLVRAGNDLYRQQVLNDVASSVQKAHEVTELLPYFPKEESSLRNLQEQGISPEAFALNLLPLRQQLINQLRTNSEPVFPGPYGRPAARSVVDTIDWVLTQIMGEGPFKELRLPAPSEPAPPVVRGVNITVTLMETPGERSLKYSREAAVKGREVVDPLDGLIYHPSGIRYSRNTGTAIYPAHTVSADGHHIRR
jgi:hypothetical protein